MKLRILLLCTFALVGNAFADEGAKIMERKTCEQINGEIAYLSGLDSLSADEQAQLKQLNQQQRSYCTTKGGGRRAIARSMPSQGTTESNQTIMITSDVLSEYIATKKSNCEKLGAEMEKLASDTTKAYLVTEMHRYYDVDCVDHKDAGVAPAAVATETGTVATVAVAAPAKTDEEIAAEFDANLAAGLCGDGSKPSRFGCCAGETFKDLGDLGFACCPRTGNVCYPPVTSIM